MTQQTDNQHVALQYDIANSLCGEGNINSVKQESGFWRSYIGSDTTRIKCLFKYISQVSRLQLRVCNSNMVQCTCFRDQVEQINQLLHLGSKQRQSKEKIVFKFKKSAQVESGFVDIHSYNKKQIQIYSIRFYGIPIKKRLPQKNQRRNLFDDARNTNQQVARQKIKQKVIRTNQKIQKNREYQQNYRQKVDQNQPRKSRKGKKPEENQQKQKKEKKQRKQGKQSEQQQQQDKQKQIKKQTFQNNAQKQMYIPENFQKDQLLQPQQEQLIPNYRKIRVRQQQIQRISGVSQKWLQNQRKMELFYGVSIQDRLSLKINPKCFSTMNFIIPNIYGQQKAKYIRMIKQLGGFIRQQLCKNCIIITQNPKGSHTVGMARLMTNTHIVRPAYIQDCYKLKTKLKIDKYQFTHEQLFI